ncbi:MAG TPA: hypothetical protein VMK66_20170 [Myxococcales bacterium]|nr:hypothetical protein [Myxococcales bacterium]
MITCALCGFRYQEDAQGCRPSCPMSRGCSLVCCPNCGHGVAKEGPVAKGVRKLLLKLTRRTT